MPAHHKPRPVLRIPIFQTAALLISLFIWAFVFRQSAADFRAYSLGDLETRIVGARCLVDGINPYNRESLQLPEYYRAFGPTTPTPAHLLLYVPLRNLPLALQRTIYFAVDWVLAFACFLAIRKVVDKRVPGLVLLLLFSSLLIFDATFRLQLTRGQLYLSLLLLSIAAASGMRKRNRGILSPLAFAVLLLLRPTYLVAFAAVALMGYRSLVARVGIALALLTAFILPITGIKPWSDWVQMISRAPGELLVRKEAGEAKSPLTPVSGRNFLSLGGFERDRTFLGLVTSRPLRRTTVAHPLAHRKLLLNINLTLLILTAIVGLYFALRLRSASDAAARIAFVFLLPIDIESFGPLRFAYSDVLLTLPLILASVSLGIAAIRKYRRVTLVTTILLSGAFAFAAVSRVPIPVSPAVLSVGRFLIALAGLNLFCIARRSARPAAPSWVTINSFLKLRYPALHNRFKSLSTSLFSISGICLPRRIAGSVVWTRPHILTTEPPEEHVLRWILDLLPPSGTFFDVGAHYGWMSIAAARRVGRAGQVIAFEPSPALVDILSYHKRVNRLPQLEIVAKAVSNSDSDAVPFFLVNEGLSFRNSLTIGSDDTPYIEPAEKTPCHIPAITLDRFCVGFDVIPDLVKIDVEGAELLVLQGAGHLLARYHPALIVAVHSYWLPQPQTVDQTFELLDHYGYEIKDKHVVDFEGGLAADYLCVHVRDATFTHPRNFSFPASSATYTNF